MNKVTHNIYISSMILIVVLVTGYLSYVGFSFYQLPIEERFYHDHYSITKKLSIGTLYEFSKRDQSVYNRFNINIIQRF
jgi:hypothetical protein